MENDQRPPIEASHAPDSRVPKLSVIVPVYNGGTQLSRCLEGLRRSEYSDFEVIVVDDRSTDNTKQIIEQYKARSVRTPRALGPAGARNMGIEFAQGRIVVFVDADVVIPPHALGLIAQEFALDSQLAAMFGSYDEEPPWKSFLSQYKNLMHFYVHQKSSEHATTFWAGCGAVRRQIFVEFGGFDAARYHEPSIEDIEFGCRLAQGGQKIRLDKRLQVKHLKKWTLRSLIRSDILCRAIPWTRLIVETRRLPRDLNLTSGARISTGLVGLLSLGWVILFLQAANIIPAIALPRTLMANVAVVTLLAGLLVAANWDVYSFFAKKRGWWFAARVVPMHWFYYLYSGVVFITFGTVHTLRRLVSSWLPAARTSRVTSDHSRTR
jgi:glycosyltransferase involved in cell wall biosynthesis